MKKTSIKISVIIISVLLTLNQAMVVRANSHEQKDSSSAAFPRKQWTDIKNSKRNYVQGEVIVKYKDGTEEVKKQSALDRVKPLAVKHRNRNINVDVVKLPLNKTVEATVNTLQKDNNVEFAQPNYIYTVKDFSSEPMLSNQWGVLNAGQDIFESVGVNGIDISLRDAWRVTQGDSNVVVGVVDTGIDMNHPDLKDRIWVNPGETPGNNIDDDKDGFIDDINGWDFYNNSNVLFKASDGDDHGTHVAGIIGASLNNIGVLGVAPNVKIMPLKFMGLDGGSTYDAIRAIQFAKSKGVKILNFSWGGADYDFALKNAIDQSGALIIASAGNDSKNNDISPDYPASYKSSNIISVAAVDNKGDLASFSDYGVKSVDVAAPGVDILSTVPRLPQAPDYSLSYEYYSGTSMAAPFVTGIAALLYSYGVQDPLIIKQKIMQGCKQAYSLNGKVAAGGIVDAYNSLMLANPNAQSLTSFNRLAGSDRYNTALEICKAGWKTSDYAVLATGTDFPDALSAAPLAKKYNAPILLTEGKKLTLDVDKELDNLKVKSVFIIGGTGAISTGIEDRLKEKNISFTRLSGASRYETSLAIANYLGGSKKVFIATGENFPDALSVAAYAAAKGMPILLTEKDILPIGLLKYLVDNDVDESYVIGGPGVISNSVLYQLPNANRIYGNDRYQTNYAVLNEFGADFNIEASYFATGENFPDALAGSVLAAATNSPIILIGGTTNVDLNTFIRSNLAKMTSKKVLGGEGVVPTISINKIFY